MTKKEIQVLMTDARWNIGSGVNTLKEGSIIGGTKTKPSSRSKTHNEEVIGLLYAIERVGSAEELLARAKVELFKKFHEKRTSVPKPPVPVRGGGRSRVDAARPTSRI